jgi:DNA-binding Lrp family transcriptional regulator
LEILFKKESYVVEKAEILSISDKRLLGILQRDATLSLKDLAEAAGMSSSSVWRRMQEFEASGLLTGRIALLDPVKMGLPVCTLIHVSMRDQSKEARAAFERFADTHDNIQQCFVMTGGYDYTIVVRSASVEAYERFLMDELLAHPSVGTSASHLVLRQHKNTTRVPIR